MRGRGRFSTAISIERRAKSTSPSQVSSSSSRATAIRALRELKSRGIETVSAIGGRTTARALLREHVIRDLYLTTAAKDGGEPDTPLLEGPLNAPTVLVKGGTGVEQGVRFTHYLCR